MRYFVALSLILLYGAFPGLRAQDSRNVHNGAGFDLSFADKLLASNLADSELDRIAVERATNDEVRKFAQSMLDSGTMTGDWIRQIFRRKGIFLPPKQTTRTDVVERLSGFTGTDFDRSYIESESAAQREQVGLCKQEIANGVDPDIKALASESLNRLRRQADLLAGLDSSAGAQAMQ